MKARLLLALLALSLVFSLGSSEDTKTESDEEQEKLFPSKDYDLMEELEEIERREGVKSDQVEIVTASEPFDDSTPGKKEYIEEFNFTWTNGSNGI